MNLIGRSKIIRQKMLDWYPKPQAWRQAKRATKMAEEKQWRKDEDEEIESALQEVRDYEEYERRGANEQ